MRAPKAILVGDHRQLPPIFNEADGISLADSLDDNNDDDTALTIKFTKV